MEKDTLAEPPATGTSPAAGGERVASGPFAALRLRDTRPVTPRRQLRSRVAQFGVLALLALAVAVFSVAEPDLFLTSENLLNILRQASLAAPIAFGVTIALAHGDFDLSIAAVIALTGGLTVDLMATNGVPWGLAVAAGLGAAALFGIGNGILVGYVGISSFIATLGTASLATAAEYYVTGRAGITFGVPDGFVAFGASEPLGIELPIVVAVLTGLLLWFALERTENGRFIRAVGGNPEAAHFAGIRIRVVRLVAFTTCAVSAGITGIVITSHSAAYQPDFGAAYLIPTYAAAFIGAAVLREGQFNIFGTAVGLVLLAVVTTGLTLVGLDAWVAHVVEGMVLVVAIALSGFGRGSG